MKFTLDWLKEHLETSAGAEEISSALTMIGLEVEEIEDLGKRLEAFVVGRIVAAQKHPNADKLRVCKVDAGTGELVDVVCGAPNARAGLNSVFAFPGTYIPGTDFVLTRGMIRGQASNGMLCSGRELELSDDHSGILELPESARPGARFIDVAGINGVVFDISITPNRGDAAGVYGVARDLAAFGLGTLRDGAVTPVPSTGGKGSIAVALEFGPDEPKACEMFAGRLIKNIKNGPSPDWLQARLRAVGLRPISALVDITNYLTYDRGRPLHVFDADTLKGVVVARMARQGESLLALDGKTYELDETICVIADDSGPISIGGIMGGEATGSSETTRNVFIECAWFDPRIVASGGRKTGIVSDARYRFERIVDPEGVRPGLELATRMVHELCGGEVCEPVIAGEVSAPDPVIEFPLSEVRRLTGLEVPAGDIRAILERLGFKITGDQQKFMVRAPSWRPDVTIKADLVEEIMRMVGVDKVPVAPLPRLTGVAPLMLTPMQNRRRIVRRALAARGLDEAITWSFVSGPEAARFGGGGEALKLANPIAAEMTDMRPSLLPGLLAAAGRNANRGFPDIGLFEVGQVFLSDTPDGQHYYASGIRSGGTGRHWREPGKSVDVFNAKADLVAALDVLGVDIEKAQLAATPAPWAHPGRGGRVQLGPKITLGWFGEIHPGLCEALDLTGPIAAFEIDLDAIPLPRRKPSRTRPALGLSDLMAVNRDFSFVVDRQIEAGTIIKAARGAGKALITGVDVFDLFEGPSLGDDKKSVGIAVTLQPRDKTLTEGEIEALSGAIVAAVARATGGTLRQ